MKKARILLILLSLISSADAFMMSFALLDVSQDSRSASIGVTADVDAQSFALSVRLSGPIESIAPVGYNRIFTNSTLSSDGTVMIVQPAWYIKSAGGRMTSPTADPLVPAGQPVYTFTVNLLPGYYFMLGDQYLNVDDYKGVLGGGMAVKTTLNGTETFMSPFAISVMPEPTTLVLLGLGGLLLRRKK